MNQQLAPLTQTRAIMPHAIADSVRDYVGHSKADNTRVTYRKAWVAYEAFCAQQSYPAGDVGAVVHYLTQLADDGYKVATIELHKSAISFMHGGRTGAGNTLYRPKCGR